MSKLGLFGKLDMPKESKRRVKERLRPYVKVKSFPFILKVLMITATPIGALIVRTIMEVCKC